MNPIKHVSLIALASCLVCVTADAMQSSRSPASSSDESRGSRRAHSARHHDSPPVSLAPSALSSTVASSRGADSPVPSDAPSTSASSSHRSHRSHHSSRSSVVASVADEPASSSSSSRRHHHSSRSSAASSVADEPATPSSSSSRRHHHSSRSSAASSVADSSVRGSQVFRAETGSVASSRAPSRSSHRSDASDVSRTSRGSARSSASSLSTAALDAHNKRVAPLSQAAIEMLDAVSMSSSIRQSEAPLLREHQQHRVGRNTAAQVLAELAARDDDIRSLEGRYDVVVQYYLEVLNDESFRAQQADILSYLSDRTFEKHHGLFENVAEMTSEGATRDNIKTHLELYQATKGALPKILERLTRKGDSEAVGVISENWRHIQQALDTLLEEDESLGTLLHRLTAEREAFVAENHQYLPLQHGSASASRFVRDDAVTDYAPSIAATSVSLGSAVPSVAAPRPHRSERSASSASASDSVVFDVSSRTSSTRGPSASRHGHSERSHHRSSRASVAASSEDSFARAGVHLDAASDSWSITTSQADVPVAPAARSATAQHVRAHLAAVDAGIAAYDASSFAQLDREEAARRSHLSSPSRSSAASTSARSSTSRQLATYRQNMEDRETARRAFADSVHTAGDEDLAARLQWEQEDAADWHSAEVASNASSRHHGSSSSSSRSSSRR